MIPDQVIWVKYRQENKVIDGGKVEEIWQGFLYYNNSIRSKSSAISIYDTKLQ